MATTVPSYLLPAVTALGVHWPDINEDDVYNLGADFSDFGSAISGLGMTVADLIAELRQANSAEALDGLATHWTKIQGEFLEPASTAFNLAQQCCDDAYNAIRIYKTGLLSYLDIEVGSILLTDGLAALIRIAGHKAIDRAVEGMAYHIEGEVIARFTGPLRSAVYGEIQGLVAKGGALAERATYNELAQVVPVVNLTRLEGQLVVSAVSLDHAMGRIGSSLAVVDKAATTLRSEYMSKSFTTHSGAHADSRLRDQITSFLQSFVPEVTSEVKTLCEQLIVHATGLVNLFGDNLTHVDNSLAGRAGALNQIDEGLAVSARSSGASGAAIQGGSMLLQGGGAALLTGGTIVKTWKQGTGPTTPVESTARAGAPPQDAASTYGTGAAGAAAAEKAYVSNAGLHASSAKAYIGGYGEGVADQWGAQSYNCTSWAEFRRSQLGLSTPSGEGYQMAGNAGAVPASQAHLGSLVSLPPTPTNSAGHVMVVEKVIGTDPPHFIVSQMNYDNGGSISTDSTLTYTNGHWVLTNPENNTTQTVGAPTFSS